jgi:hypothetical protein
MPDLHTVEALFSLCAYMVLRTRETQEKLLEIVVAEWLQLEVAEVCLHMLGSAQEEERHA